jgi:hypothetical protein
MEKENLYLIHGEDYLRHIEEKLELLWMATILMHYIKNGAEKDGYLDLVRRSTLDFDERCEEMFSSWGRALNYLKSRDLADLSDLIENDLIEPEYAGYIPADNPCCPGERCCEYAERIEREYAAKKDADADMDEDEENDVFEYDEDSEADTDATISSLYALLSVSDCLSKLAAGLISASDHLLELLDKELRSYGD